MSERTMTTEASENAISTRAQSGPMAMVEKVARAIYSAMDVTDGLDTAAAERYARAAIEAMREPNIAMRRVCDFRTAEVEWPAMIDAALNEGRVTDAEVQQSPASHEPSHEQSNE